MKSVFWVTTMAFLGNLSSAAAAGPLPSRWSDARGFISSAGCQSRRSEETEFFVADAGPNSRTLLPSDDRPARAFTRARPQPITDYVIHSIQLPGLETVGRSRVSLAQTYWQPAMSGSKFEILVCHGRPYLVFDVFLAGHERPVDRVGVTANEIGLFSRSRISTTAEVDLKMRTVHEDQKRATREQRRDHDRARADDDDDDETVTDDQVVCLDDGHRHLPLQVRDRKLRSVVFEASDLDPVRVLTKKNERKPELTVDGEKLTFVRVKFLDREDGEMTGFIAEKFVMSKAQCRESSNPEPPPIPAVAPTPPPRVNRMTTPVRTPVRDARARGKGFNPLIPNCAEKALLKGAKKSVARHWHNRSAGHGACAKGVRFSLEESGVGDIHGGLGNAVDLVAALKNYGYVDSGLTDVSRAPAGAVLIFGGRFTSRYFKNHRIGKPPGNWVGHVTIKGDDGYYYTDARTRDAAVGWIGARNVRHVRNILAIMVPGEDIVTDYVGQCTL